MAKPAKATGIAADIAAMKAIGMSDEQIRAKMFGPVVADIVQTAAPSQPPQTADKRMDRANLGPDPELVARLEAYRATHKPAVLEETFEVTLKKRYVDYVNQYAAMVSARRPNSEPINASKAIEIIVMAYRNVDPDRALLEGPRGRTAPAALPPGTWAQKTA
jgi:hypothetical protein